MLTENGIFFPDAIGTDLYDSRRLTEARMVTPEVMQFEMQYPHHKTYLKIESLTQEGLEYFVSHHGMDYEVLYLWDCRRIKDFSPLEDMKNLKAVRIEWCRDVDRLWDFSKNPCFQILSIHEAKKICENPIELQRSQSLEEVRLWGSMDCKYPLESMECFRGMPSLQRIDLNLIQLKNKDMAVLDSIPNLKEFHFDAGMLTTEEIAWICAKYPHIAGDCLGPYTTNDIYSDLRICGYRKPGLTLPRDQKKLERYIAQFEVLVEEYRNKMK